MLESESSSIGERTFPGGLTFRSRTSLRSSPVKITGIPYRLTYYIWVHAPNSIRERVNGTVVVRRLKNGVRDVLAAGGDRDDIYNKTYYTGIVDSLATQSSGPISRMIIEEFNPTSAIDMGCGTGAMLIALHNREISVQGLEYSRSALRICRERGLDVRTHNIEENHDVTHLGRFDVAICTEVAEHVKPQFAGTLVRQLVTLADHVVFSAATPGQGGGVDHVNEQPNSYWITKFRDLGYLYLEERTNARRKSLSKQGVASFYANNLMLFERNDAIIDAAS